MIRIEGADCLEAVVSPGHRRHVDAGFLGRLDVANLIPHQKNLPGLQLMRLQDLSDHPTLPRELGRSADEVEKLDVEFLEEDGDILGRVGGQDSELEPLRMKASEDFKHSVERLNAIHSPMEFLFATFGNFRQTGGRNAQIFHQFAIPHITREGNILVVQTTVFELHREQVENFPSALEGICHGSIKIKKQKLGTGHQPPGCADTTPPPAHHKSCEPLHPGSASRYSMGPLNDSSFDSMRSKLTNLPGNDQHFNWPHARNRDF